MCKFEFPYGVDSYFNRFYTTCLTLYVHGFVYVHFAVVINSIVCPPDALNDILQVASLGQLYNSEG